MGLLLAFVGATCFGGGLAIASGFKLKLSIKRPSFRWMEVETEPGSGKFRSVGFTVTWR